jgi:EAL domain-containing protein (putative c-di-GMP-specific phosphodiesterase class I)
MGKPMTAVGANMGMMGIVSEHLSRECNLTLQQNLLAMRHVAGLIAESNMKNPGSHGGLAGVFELMMAETMGRAHDFNETVAEGAFDLAFEPIVDLKSGATSHYEALTRFQPGESPAETIRFAEDLGLTDAFDVAVADKAFTLLEENPFISSLAINVSGRSIAKPASFAAFAALLEKKRAFAKRLQIELTETAEVPDLSAAGKAIQVLRGLGYRVGIDDFGAGASSLQYLHRVPVDFLKVDGAVIHRIDGGEREDALPRSVLETCAKLNIETIAEWVDSPERLARCAEMGFGYGQGRQFGATASELPKAAA